MVEHIFLCNNYVSYNKERMVAVMSKYLNETLEVIAKRYSCRDYKSEMPSDEMLEAIAEAAIQAPSAMNRQPWRIIVVKNKELMQELENEALNQLKNMEDKSAYNRIMNRGGKLFYNAPCMIIIPVEQNKDNYPLIDCGIVCQNITIAASSLGLASVICGLTGVAFSDSAKAEKWAKRLGFPEGYMFGCSVLLGYANTSKDPHEPDKSKIIVVD